MKKILLTLLALAGSLFAQNVDVIIPGQTNPYLPIVVGKAWGSLNANYVFSPITTDSTICVYIANNNPTNSHTLTLALSSTGDSAVNAFANNPLPWVSVPIINVTFPVTVAANSTNAYFYKSQAAAKLALVVTGATTAAGSPDTATINVVQPSTSSTCGAAANAVTISNVIGAVANGNPIPAASQLPVLVGGQQAVGGAGFLNTAQYAAVDSGTHGLVIGVAGTGVTESGAPVGTCLNYDSNIVGGGCTVLFTQNEGQQTDIPMGGGAGDTMSPFRCSKPYGCTASNIFGWSASQSAAASGSPLQAFVARNDVANPALNTLVLEVAPNTGANNGISLYRVIVSCSAACDFFIQRTTDTGTACAAGTVSKPYDTTLTGTISNYSATVPPCTTAPTSTAVFFHIFLGAGQVFNSGELSGYYWRAAVAAGNGFDILNGTALTGTLTATIEFMGRGGSGI